jgi:hypothetical protein
MRAVLLLGLAACTGTEGTLTVKLATAPGSTLLSSVQRLRLTLTNPELSFETERTDSGLDLAFSIDAVESNGLLLVEGFDGNDSPVLVGQSPPFPLAGADATIHIYVAPPYSILEAPVRVEVARSQIAAVPLIYGVAFAGGLDESGAPTKTMSVYNVYDHSISTGEDLPVARANVTLAANDNASVYVFGGTDEQTAPTSTLYRFQTNVAPRGAYFDLGAHPGLESAAATAVKLGPDTFFVTGAQPAILSASLIAPRTDLADVPPTCTAATAVDGTPIAACVTDTAVLAITEDSSTSTDTAGTDRVIAARPENGTALVVGGDTRDALVVAFASQSLTTHPDVLSIARRSPSIAATSRHIVVVGGLDENGAPIASADVLDATTLELLATVPVTPRTHAVAVPLTNDQIMLLGGDEPSGLIELFTPPAPTDPALP